MMVEGRDLPWLLNHWAGCKPEKPMLIWAPFEGADKIWTFAEVEAEVRKLAGWLVSKGVKKGGRVLVHMENCPEFLFSWFACAYIGATAVTTNSRSVERDLNYFCDHAEVVGAITQPQYVAILKASAPELDFMLITETDSGAPAEAPVPFTDQVISYADIEQAAPFEGLRPADYTLDLSIQFTSGTTSRPKAVVWTHGNVLYAGQQGSRNYRLRPDDICHIYLPLFHMYAISQTFMSALWMGNTVILQRKFSKSNFWRPALQYKATWAAQIPFAAQAMIDLPVPEHDFRFWSLAVSYPEMEAHYRIKSIGSWGMTETVSCPVLTDLDHESPMMSLGRPLPGYDVAILKEDGTPAKAGEGGRLYVRGIRGLNLFKEYLKDPEATARSFDENGWFDTGDMVKTDVEGNLYFGDRLKDMLKIGGENVAASEIETVIMGLSWAKECAVVGQKHYMLGEVAVAFVIPEEDAPENAAEEVIRLCRQSLADFKVVRSVHLVEELPRSLNNKVAKNKLRESLPAIET